MDKLFEIIFLDEAFDFLKSLEQKHYEKFFTTYEKLKMNKTLNYSKN
jgi:mRNA-degrading endonuclease RelE of RelBE toxin-antitoxin system